MVMLCNCRCSVKLWFLSRICFLLYFFTFKVCGPYLQDFCVLFWIIVASKLFGLSFRLLDFLVISSVQTYIAISIFKYLFFFQELLGVPENP